VKIQGPNPFCVCTACGAVFCEDHGLAFACRTCIKQLPVETQTKLEILSGQARRNKRIMQAFVFSTVGILFVLSITFTYFDSLPLLLASWAICMCIMCSYAIYMQNMVIKPARLKIKNLIDEHFRASKGTKQAANPGRAPFNPFNP
jgi:hypothetical protein